MQIQTLCEWVVAELGAVVGVLVQPNPHHRIRTGSVKVSLAAAPFTASSFFLAVHARRIPLDDFLHHIME
jgi:hypothetical protein